MKKETKMTYRRDRVQLKKLGLYLLLHQITSGITILFITYISELNLYLNIILANLVTSLVLFWIDRLVFQRKKLRMRMWDYK